MSEELRKAELRKACLDAHVDRVTKFLRTYGCHLANHTDITNEIRGMMNTKGEDWPWVEKWATEDALAWVNDLQTVVFEVPLSNLAGRKCLDFTQEVWSFQPSVFEYQTWGGRTFVRIHWDDQSSCGRLVQAIKSASNQGNEPPATSRNG